MKAWAERQWAEATKLRLYKVIGRFRIWDWFVLFASFMVVVWDSTAKPPIWTVALVVYWIQRINNIDQEVSREDRENSKLELLKEISKKMDTKNRG